MNQNLQKLLKKSGLILLLMGVISSCKKETTIKPIPTEPEVKTSSVKGKIDGKDFSISQNNIKSTLYATNGDAVKSLETSATLDANGNKLTFFIDDLKNGAIALSKKAGTSLNPGTKTIKLNAATSQTYVQYYNEGNAYYALSGSISITVTDTYVTVKWDIKFKTADGREFSSAGEFTITFASVVTKEKSEIKDPTPVADKPTIENIAPTKGRAGDVISITGVNYSATTADNIVEFNGTKAEVVSATTTKLTVKAPVAGTTGAVSLKVKNSEITTGPAFTYIQAATFTSFTPASAKVGETVTITGSNFSTEKSENIVKFSGAQGTAVTATVTEATATQIKVTVPQSAITGKITLNVLNGGELTSPSNFTLLNPTTNTGDWQDMDFTASIQESNISAAMGNGFMFAGGANSTYLYYSENGTSYTNVYNKMQSANGAAIEVHLIKTDGVYYYITTNQGIFRTDGTVWKKLSPWPASPNMSVTGLIAARGGNLACMQGALLFTSSDSGDNWTLSQATKPNGNTLDYLTSDSFGKYWYAVDMSSNYLSSPTQPKIYKSADQGKSWTAGAATTGLYFFGSGNQDFITASGYNIFCLFSPSTASMTDQRLYKTSDQGATWTKLSDDNVYYVKSFGDFVVYGDGRFNVSVDGGATFKNYDVPTGYRVGGVERSNGYFYIFTFNSNTGQRRIFRKKI
ncbi:IPT/TIG domain-containing protein [Mucilaginibacter lutimaris]|uniref:IPT/TIG domain-containing protein n=1 Tax=Mucilaginibacter lutimaris TaxID=931629 RepID=A0ABW2ZCK9_9SPHI